MQDQWFDEKPNCDSRKWLRLFILFFCAACFALGAFVEVHADSTTSRPTIMVLPEASIVDTKITLGQISRINNPYPEFEQLVNLLRSISLGEAPPPTMKTSISGQKILQAIRDAGVAEDSFGYSIPKMVTIERKGHLVSTDEILPLVRSTMAGDPTLDLQVREVSWANAQVLPVGETEFKIERLGQPEGGKLPLRINAFVNNIPAARFLATALVDDWREVPVLNKSVDRGMLISPEDVEVVRLNLFKQPADVVDHVESVIGRRAKQRLGAGEAIRKSVIDIPPTIPKGKTLTIVYRSGGISATATGTALEDGFDEGLMKVRNDNSRRILKAKVIDSERVEVSAQ